MSLDDPTCPACGYVDSDTASVGDRLHDLRCCGTPYCTDPGNCTTHDEPQEAPR